MTPLPHISTKVYLLGTRRVICFVSNNAVMISHANLTIAAATTEPLPIVMISPHHLFDPVAHLVLGLALPPGSLLQAIILLIGLLRYPCPFPTQPGWAQPWQMQQNRPNRTSAQPHNSPQVHLSEINPLEPTDLGYAFEAMSLQPGHDDQWYMDTGASYHLTSDPDENGNYPPLKVREPGLSRGAIGGIIVGVVAVALFLVGYLFYGVHTKKNSETNPASLRNAHIQLMSAQAPIGSSIKGLEAIGVPTAGLGGITVDKSVEFSYEELSIATHEFSLANKIGQGGFGAVYYAELRGEKAAIKKMDMQASRQFLAELKVLTLTHHLNLVRLIGYCTRVSLFLVYEYMENGNLSEHIHGLERDPLPWSTRVQVALDSARGLEYIHEHSVPAHIHCDIKSTNILIDKNFRAKVADFGLTKLTGAGSASCLGGTFGYMPPEYVQYGEVSPKVDVYAFGVVLYELISAKQAIIRGNDSDDEPKGLVALFDEVLSQVDQKDDLIKMIDPRLGDNYLLNSVHKMAQLAKACTHEDPRQRPSMRSIVVLLMTLSSYMED